MTMQKLTVLLLPAMTIACSSPPAYLPSSASGASLALADAKAQEALPTLRRLTRAPLDSPTHTLGESFPVFFVGLADLQRYDGKSDPAVLLQPTSDRFYPVIQGGTVVSSVTLTNVDGAWRPAVMGQTILAARLHATRTRLRGLRRADDDLFGAVKIPALNKHYLIHREGAAMLLTPLEDKGGGTPVALADLFASLAESARSLPAVP